MKKLRMDRALPFISGFMFLLLILLLKTIDVATVSETGKTIGLSHLNIGFHNLTGVNMIWYTITQVAGIFLLAVAAFFAFIGFMQLLKRKNLFKVDHNIIAVGVLYAVVIVLYVFFEKVIINYRPIIMEGKSVAEASFPSSHTMLVCVVMGSALLILKDYVKNESHCNILKGICIFVIALTVLGRLVCGVHWFTDILGGVLISLTLLSVFNLFLEKK